MTTNGKLTKEQEKALESMPVGQWKTALDLNLKPVVLQNLVKKGMVKMKPCYFDNAYRHTDGFVYMRKKVAGL